MLTPHSELTRLLMEGKGPRSTSHNALPWKGIFAHEGVHSDAASFSLQRVTRHIIPSYQDEEHPPRKDGLVS